MSKHHVVHHLVVQIVNVELLMVNQYVLVFLSILVVRQHAAQNVFKTVNVARMKHVRTKSAVILALELVELVLHVLLLITIQFVVAQVDILAILLLSVTH